MENKQEDTFLHPHAIVIICREYDKYQGRPPLVYDTGADFSKTNLTVLGLRSRFNPELAYFAVLRKVWEENKDYITESILKEHKFAEFEDFIDDPDAKSILESRGIIRIH